MRRGFWLTIGLAIMALAVSCGPLLAQTRTGGQPMNGDTRHEMVGGANGTSFQYFKTDDYGVQLVTETYPPQFQDVSIVLLNGTVYSDLVPSRHPSFKSAPSHSRAAFKVTVLTNSNANDSLRLYIYGSSDSTNAYPASAPYWYRGFASPNDTLKLALGVPVVSGSSWTHFITLPTAYLAPYWRIVVARDFTAASSQIVAITYLGRLD